MFDEFDGFPDACMTVNDLHCVFNMPTAIKKEKKFEVRLTLLNEQKKWVEANGLRRKFENHDEARNFVETIPQNQYKDVEVLEAEEEIASLPPYAPRKAFKVDEYNCPVNWMHGSGLASSYFVPVLNDRGMWLDFNKNFNHTHHVAILISVQGVNPLDGQSMVEDSLSLKQYKTKCPVHDIEFGGDKYCSKCGYKWVPQNYLATTSTPNGYLWLDGFLASDGVVRQYVFTEHQELGVAHQIIGEQKKVYSIGIAFYLSKNPKPCQKVYSGFEKFSFCSVGQQHTNSSILRSSVKKKSFDVKCSYDPSDFGSLADQSFDDVESLEQTSFDIAAGSKIFQKIYPDHELLSFWEEKPAGILYINYSPAENVKSILKKGKKDLTKKGEGFLAGLKVNS